MSRIALVYSTRFSRWRPGAGRCVSAWRSNSLSSHTINESIVALSGRREFVGGISPARSLRTTFSQTCAFSPTFARSRSSIVRRIAESILALFARWLWQAPQYWSRTARWPAVPVAAVLALALGACGLGAAVVWGRGALVWPETITADRIARALVARTFLFMCFVRNYL